MAAPSAEEARVQGTFPLLDLGVAALVVVSNLVVYTFHGLRVFDDSLFVEGLVIIVAGTAMAVWSPATRRRVIRVEKEADEASLFERRRSVTKIGLRVILVGIIVILVSVAVGELAPL